MGPALSPFNAFLILTGIETLPLRMQRHRRQRACAVAEFLADHPAVAWVELSRPAGRPLSHARPAATAPRAPAPCFTFGLEAAATRRASSWSRAVQAVLASRQYRRHALADHPPGLDHPSPAQRTRRRSSAGAGPDVVRLSIGIEDEEDIIADLEQALA